MQIETITKEKMEALQALADTNMKIGEVRNTLALLKAEEMTYLLSREEKAMKAVQVVLSESENVLKQSFANYEEIKKLANEASSFAQFLAESYQEFENLKVTFDKYTIAFENSIKLKETELIDLQNLMKLDKAQIKAEQEAINKAYENIAVEKVKIKDSRETLERAFNRLKK